jgi:hypothetical protein
MYDICQPSKVEDSNVVVGPIREEATERMKEEATA